MADQKASSAEGNLPVSHGASSPRETSTRRRQQETSVSVTGLPVRQETSVGPDVTDGGEGSAPLGPPGAVGRSRVRHDADAGPSSPHAGAGESMEWLELGTAEGASPADEEADRKCNAAVREGTRQQDPPLPEAGLCGGHGSDDRQTADVAGEEGQNGEGQGPSDHKAFVSQMSTVSESTLKANETCSSVCAENAEKPGTVACNSSQLCIETRAELEEFLREILKDFVDKVIDVKGLMDHLLAEGCLTLSDEESLNGKDVPTRAHQAWKVWSFMHSMSVEDFKVYVCPELVTKYRHIIPDKYFMPREGESRSAENNISKCLRHNIIFRARLSTVANSLYQCQSLKLEKLLEFIKNCRKLTDTELWGCLFRAMAGQDEVATGRAAGQVHAILQHYRLEVPEDLAEQIKQGVPCTCRLHVDDLPPSAYPFQHAEETQEVSGAPGTYLQPGRASVSPFQTPGSQYLGSEDPDFRPPELDPDFVEWAKSEGLREAALTMLQREEYVSKDDLRLLEVDSIETHLHRFSSLPGKQRQIVKRMIQTVKSEAPPVSVRQADAPPSVPALNDLLADLQETMRLLMVGKTGAGKSASGNTILGMKKFAANLSMRSTTQRSQFACSGDEKVQVMDCPGLFDTSMSLEELCTVIVQAVVAMYPRPSAVLYTVRIGVRYTDEEFETYRRLKILFGNEVCRYIIILFTCGDELKKAGVTIKEYIKEAPERFKDVLRECGSRYVVFDNSEEGRNEQQLADLREKVCELMTRDAHSPSPWQKFSLPKEDLKADVRRCIRKMGDFRAKESILRQAFEAMKELFRRIWEFILDVLTKLGLRPEVVVCA